MKFEKQRIRPGKSLAEQIRANRSIPLAPYLRRLARASVVASALASAACAGSSTDVDEQPVGDAGVEPPDSGPTDSQVEVPTELAAWIEEAELIRPQCDGRNWRATEGLDPAFTGYDYLAVSACELFACFTAESGTPCVTDDDSTECQEQVANALYDTPKVITTLGTEVVTYEGKEGLMDFLGDVNTPQEALLVALFDWYSVRCDDPNLGAVRLAADGYDVVVTRITEDCDPIVDTRYLLHVGTDGEVTELDSQAFSVTYGLCIGRRPAGLQAPQTAATDSSAGEYFAKIATLEAAAVVAFERLAVELSALDAPESLVEDARAAACDEARHAQIMGDVARHFGVEPEAPSVAVSEARDPCTIALENGVEGCVRETFGALTGCYQGLCASDPVVASALRRVSEDEIRHAELSLRVDEFLQGLLSVEERARLASAKRQAIVDLRAEIAAPPPTEVCTVAGYPEPVLAARWIDRLEQDLWLAPS